jgi:hypothetical protein
MLDLPVCMKRPKLLVVSIVRFRLERGRLLQPTPFPFIAVGGCSLPCAQRSYHISCVCIRPDILLPFFPPLLYAYSQVTSLRQIPAQR